MHANTCTAPPLMCTQAGKVIWNKRDEVPNPTKYRRTHGSVTPEWKTLLLQVVEQIIGASGPRLMKGIYSACNKCCGYFSCCNCARQAPQIHLCLWVWVYVRLLVFVLVFFGKQQRNELQMPDGVLEWIANFRSFPTTVQLRRTAFMWSTLSWIIIQMHLGDMWITCDWMKARSKRERILCADDRKRSVGATDPRGRANQKLQPSTRSCKVQTIDNVNLNKDGVILVAVKKQR